MIHEEERGLAACEAIHAHGFVFVMRADEIGERNELQKCAEEYARTDRTLVLCALDRENVAVAFFRDFDFHIDRLSSLTLANTIYFSIFDLQKQYIFR